MTARKVIFNSWEWSFLYATDISSFSFLPILFLLTLQKCSRKTKRAPSTKSQVATRRHGVTHVWAAFASILHVGTENKVFVTQEPVYLFYSQCDGLLGDNG